MSPFDVKYKTPGVYIDEVAVAGPIAGTGTSTAAFIGPAQRGPINQPTFLTNWTQFQEIFGGYITSPMVLVTHAVRGFFENGGTTCYFTRVGTAARASLPLKDRSTPGFDTIVVTAKQEGATGNAITVKVDDASLTSPVLPIVRAQATLSSTSDRSSVTVADATEASRFRIGDTVFLQHDTTSERAVITNISGNTITFEPDLTNSYNGGTIRIANLPSAQATLSTTSTDRHSVTVTDAREASRFRIGDTVFLQHDNTSERAVISNISGTTITFELALTNSYDDGTIRTADLFRVQDAASIQRGDILCLAQGTTTSELVFVESVNLQNKAISLRAPGLTGQYTMASSDSPVTVQPFIYVVRSQAALDSASGKTATLTATADNTIFRVGDTVVLAQDGRTDRAVISRIREREITFQNDLRGSYTGGTIRIADLVSTQRTFRVADATGLEPGSCIQLSQGVAGTSETLIVEGVDTAGFVTVQTPGIQNPYSLREEDAPLIIQSWEFSLDFLNGAEYFPNLSMDQRHSRYFGKVVDSKLVDISLADPPTPTPPPNNRPLAVETSLGAGVSGRNDNLSALTANVYQDAIHELKRVDDVNLLSIPDCVNQDLIGRNGEFTQAVQQAMLEHCQTMQDRFAILDPLSKLDPIAADGILGQRLTVGSDGGFGAIYYPQIIISNPVGPGRIQVPPSGHIAGVYARTDATRGVFKAPANETIRGVLALERTLTEDEQGLLNENEINVLRAFPGRGTVVWGARTLSKSTQWQYINVRRLLLFIEESIQEGTRFAVFEPNNLALWQTVKRQVTEFLTRVWRDGGLFGATPDQAFRVRVDEELNPPSTRALGQLVIEVIVVPTTPAEFIVFRVIQDSTGASLQE